MPALRPLTNDQLNVLAGAPFRIPLKATGANELDPAVLKMTIADIREVTMRGYLIWTVAADEWQFSLTPAGATVRKNLARLGSAGKRRSRSARRAEPKRTARSSA